MHRITRRSLAGVGALALVIAGAAGAGAAPGNGKGADNGKGKGKGVSEVRDVGPDYNNGKALSMKVQKNLDVPGKEHSKNAKVGDVRLWLALDDYTGQIYIKNYELRGVGDHIEIWVATDLAFPEGDCRNSIDGGELVTVTDEQVDQFVDEFDNNMYPKESEAFSVAPRRNGSQAVLDDILSDQTASKKKGGTKLPASYYLGGGDKTVTLVDNVRDANYYAPDTPDGQTYIAGFHYSTFNEYVDRNVMTVDAYDWLHRTGANPPDDSSDPQYTSCDYASGAANPYLYEGVFAHEYQHLLEYYADTDEVNWVNEGLSDWAQTLTGYVDPNVLPTDPNADSHIACFQGFLPESFGGPENSLTQWGDQGGPEILCDYGAAYTFMEYLHGRFDGDAFMSALHTEPANGMEGLANVLAQFGHTESPQEIVHDWLAMVALDNAIDGGATGAGADLTSPTLKSLVDWSNPQAYESPGAPPNGGDFVPLDAGAQLTFTGAGAYPEAPLEWTSDGDRLYSGKGNNLDRAIVFQDVAVPAGDASMEVTMEWATELGWDFAFVQVWDPSTDSWVSLADNEGFATTDHDPGAIPAVVDNLPGYTGPGVNGDEPSGSQTLTYDLSPYSGGTVDVAFRYITDGAVVGDGFWVDDVTVGGALVTDGSAVGTGVSLTEAHPVPVDGWTVQVVGYTDGTESYRAPLALTQQGDGSWTGALGSVPGLDTVGAIVTADDPNETAPGYPTYQLALNGTVQPGGS